MSKKITDYFRYSIEYPKDVIHEPLPDGILYEYISSTYLNGFVNYVHPLGLWVLDRYTELDEDLSENNIQIYKSNEFMKWFKFQGTKQELINGFVSGELSTFHLKLNMFHDDVILLGQFHDYDGDIVKNQYIYFWFDQDVSDCQIGKFSTTDPIEEVLESVNNLLKYTIEDKFLSGYHQLPFGILKGWSSF